ncbi:hypothetical protein Dsin_001786 [Dipteronia sinensis]|uniref:Uncharacterized protein n=1 Tax=Dipteronia sinensis TaxID=43782 RepID=A0AAE0B5X0_9ROSI|nr:hypothetical protein Dsin_001786 [Dipteronia sinensis]
MIRARRHPPPAEDPVDARRRKGNEPMERPAERNPKFARRLKSNKRKIMVVERGLNFKDLEEGGSVRVRGKNVSFNVKDNNEWWETRSYPQWVDGYKPNGIYKLYNQSLANFLQDTEYAIWNTSNMFVQGQLDFKSAFWHTFFSYSLFL